MTAMQWPKTSGGFFCLRSRSKSKKGAGTAALPGWNHGASFPGPRQGHGACDRYENCDLHCWNCQIQGREASSIRQKNKTDKSLGMTLHPQLLGQGHTFGSPLLGGARLWRPGGDHVRGDKIGKRSCAQQSLLPIDLPLENMHAWGGAGGGQSRCAFQKDARPGAVLLQGRQRGPWGGVPEAAGKDHVGLRRWVSTTSCIHAKRLYSEVRCKESAASPQR